MVNSIWQVKCVHVNRKFAREYVKLKLAVKINTENFAYN